MPQALQRYDPLDVMLPPFAPSNLACPAPYRPPDSLLFPVRSTEYLPSCYRKHCAPNPDELLMQSGNTRDCDGWRVQLSPTPSGPLQQDCAHCRRHSLPNLTQGLMRSYRSASLPVRLLRPGLLGKKRSLQDAHSDIAL